MVQKRGRQRKFGLRDAGSSVRRMPAPARRSQCCDAVAGIFLACSALIAVPMSRAFTLVPALGRVPVIGAPGRMRCEGALVCTRSAGTQIAMNGVHNDDAKQHSEVESNNAAMEMTVAPHRNIGSRSCASRAAEPWDRSHGSAYQAKRGVVGKTLERTRKEAVMQHDMSGILAAPGVTTSAPSDFVSSRYDTSRLIVV